MTGMTGTPVILYYYIMWHYTGGFRDVLRIALNIQWFLFHFFSIPIIVKTLFAPYKRLAQEKPEHFDAPLFFSALLVNGIMRLAGALIRGAIIAVGFLMLAAAAVLSASAIIIWPFLPIVVVLGVLFGILSFFVL